MKDLIAAIARVNELLPKYSDVLGVSTIGVGAPLKLSVQLYRGNELPALDDAPVVPCIPMLGQSDVGKQTVTILGVDIFRLVSSDDRK